MSGADGIDWGGGEGSKPALEEASKPTLERIYYQDKSMKVDGHPQTVHQIIQTGNIYAFFTNVANRITAIIMLSISAIVFLYSPPSREYAALWLVVPTWIVALGIGGYEAFTIRFSNSGINVTGQTAATKKNRDETEALVQSVIRLSAVSRPERAPA